MDGLFLQLTLVAFLVVMNALFAGSELALVSLREGQLNKLQARGGSGAVLVKLVRDPNRFLATIQIGVTLAGFLASASAAVTLAEPLRAPLGFLGEAAEPVAVLLVTLVLSYFTLVFGEIAPKRIALQRAESWGLVAARPLAFLAQVARPALWVISRSSDLAVRLFGGDPQQHREDITTEELRDMVAVQSGFSPQQRVIISGAIDISERTLREVLKPRTDVLVLDSEATVEQAIAELVRSGHSRAPVAPGTNLDAVTGVVHLRDLVELRGSSAGRGSSALSGSVDDAASPPLLFPESAKVLEALKVMQAGRQHLAVVIGEYGSGEGIVTIEDILEELVGEIYDESDRDVVSIEKLEDGTMEVPGRFPIHDLVDIGVHVPEGEYATVAGLVLDKLRFIPKAPGDSVFVDDWELTVLGVKKRTVTKVGFRRVIKPIKVVDE